MIDFCVKFPCFGLIFANPDPDPEGRIETDPYGFGSGTSLFMVRDVHVKSHHFICCNKFGRYELFKALL